MTEPTYAADDLVHRHRALKASMADKAAQLLAKRVDAHGRTIAPDAPLSEGETVQIVESAEPADFRARLNQFKTSAEESTDA